MRRYVSAPLIKVVAVSCSSQLADDKMVNLLVQVATTVDEIWCYVDIHAIKIGESSFLRTAEDFADPLSTNLASWESLKCGTTRKAYTCCLNIRPSPGRGRPISTAWARADMGPGKWIEL